jgi:hypothetical protein
VGGNGVLFFAMGKKKKKIKGFQSCLPTLPAYFPLKLAYGQFLPKIPGPVSQTKLKKKKNYGGDAVLIKKNAFDQLNKLTREFDLIRSHSANIVISYIN